MTKVIKSGLLGVTVATLLLTGCAGLRTQGPTTNSGIGVPVTDRTVAQRILDQSIENTAKTNINAIDPRLYQRSRIGVDSFYSVVLLTGEVPDQETKTNVATIVSSMPDVKKMYDKLNVAADKGASYTVHDGYITSKLNAKILATDTIRSSQVKVVTDDGVVYVLGKLTPTQRGHLINIVESTAGVKELVLLTDLIDDNGAIINESSVSQEEGLEPPNYNMVTPTQSRPIQVVNEPNAQSNAASNSSNSVNNTGTGNSTQMNTAPGPSQRPADGSYASPYIEMYKQEVPGW